MLRRLGFSALMLLAVTAPSLAQQLPLPLPFPTYQGTPEDQKACQPAVFKYCQQALPDQFRILQCLQANRPNIGRACQQVLANYGQ
jgi:hypothetical protein